MQCSALRSGDLQALKQGRDSCGDGIRLQWRPIRISKYQIKVAPVVWAELAAELILALPVYLELWERLVWDLGHTRLVRFRTLELKANLSLRK